MQTVGEIVGGTPINDDANSRTDRWGNTDKR